MKQNRYRYGSLPLLIERRLFARGRSRRIFKLQKRIFQASQRGDVKAVRQLQQTLMRSWSAKAIAIRKVSQDNQSKKTAGVDGVKSLIPKARLSLILHLKLTDSLAEFNSNFGC